MVGHDQRPARTGVPATARPRVVVADDDAPTRAGVRLALERDGFFVSAEEDNADGAVAAALRDRPDVCLLDVDIPGGGIAAAEAIHTRLPSTHIVMLSESDDRNRLFAALEAGADGYLPKRMNPARLGAALRDVLDGRAALPRAHTARLIDEFRSRAQEVALVRRTNRDLTAREWDVLDCLAAGLSTRRIASQLFITQTTVRRHVGSILRKLGVATREEAARLAARRSRNLNG